VRVGDVRLGVRDEAFGGVDTDDFFRGAALQNALAERAGAAADIEPGLAGRDREPVQEFGGDRPAPAADIAFVSGALRASTAFKNSPV
jgi:hypothetical protein